MRWDKRKLARLYSSLGQRSCERLFLSGESHSDALFAKGSIFPGSTTKSTATKVQGGQTLVSAMRVWFGGNTECWCYEVIGGASQVLKNVYERKVLCREALRVMAVSEQWSGYPELCRDIPEALVSSAAGHQEPEAQDGLDYFYSRWSCYLSVTHRSKKPPSLGHVLTTETWSFGEALGGLGEQVIDSRRAGSLHQRPGQG